MTLRALVVDAYHPEDPDRSVVDAAVAILDRAGHRIRRVDLVAEGFTPVMSAAERRAYHDEGANVLEAEVAESTEAVAWADAMLFCYPTRAFTVPAVLKAWFERVLLPGVAFGFDSRGRVAPGLTHIRRLGVVTSTPHGRRRTVRARDGGRRTIMWTIRLSCAKTCLRTFVSLPTGASAADHGPALRRLRRW